MYNSIEVIHLIKSLREQKKISMSQLAQKTGISKSTLSRYESGERQFPINELGKYADALSTTVEFLLGLEEKEPNKLAIPLLGTICAGDGLLAEQNIERYLSYPFPDKRQPDYALRVNGDSMVDACIDDGDIVYMRKARWAEHNGQVVAVIINGGQEGTLKRMKWTEGSPIIQLVPENSKYNTLEVHPYEIAVCGVYVGHFKYEENKEAQYG